MDTLLNGMISLDMALILGHCNVTSRLDPYVMFCKQANYSHTIYHSLKIRIFQFAVI